MHINLVSLLKRYVPHLTVSSTNRNEALRVAFIDEIETLTDGKVQREFFSKLVKGDINGKDKVQLLYSCHVMAIATLVN